MVKGGYQIINFNGVEFSKNIPMQLSNIYDKIEGTNKAILLSGLNVNGVDYRDFMCTPIVIGNSYVIKAFGFRIYISDIDIVTIEDEVLFIGEDIDFGVDPSGVVSEHIYNRLLECLDGDLRTIKAKFIESYIYFNITAVASTFNSLYFCYNGSVWTISLNADNRIEFSGGI